MSEGSSAASAPPLVVACADANPRRGARGPRAGRRGPTVSSTRDDGVSRTAGVAALATRQTGARRRAGRRATASRDAALPAVASSAASRHRVSRCARVAPAPPLGSARGARLEKGTDAPHPTRRSRRTSRARGPCPSHLSTWWPCSPPPLRHVTLADRFARARERAQGRGGGPARGHSAQPPPGGGVTASRGA